MSWSLTKKAPKAEARQAFVAAHEEQYAYKTDGAHKAVMDKIAAFAGDVAEAAPDGTECSLTSSGHVDTSGTGSCSVSLTFYPAVPTA
jgi:hypothetical protein